MVKRWVVAVVLVAACGHTQKVPSVQEENADFVCNDRKASYVAKSGLLYAEQGITISCDSDQPTVSSYTVTKQGAREEKGAIIRASDWEEAWKQFEGAGWKYLKDCDNPEAGKGDPVTTFNVTDGETTSSFACPGRNIPFPYDRMRDGLDALVGLIK